MNIQLIELTILKPHNPTTSVLLISTCFLIDVFLMSSCIATDRLVYNGGYIQKLIHLFNSPEIL